MDDKIVLDKATFKALAVDTRVQILKLLLDKPYTLSDMSALLAMSNSTVKEHVDVLVKAELISPDNDGRKWKYYSLTFKGRRFIQPGEVKVFFAFCLSGLAALVTGGGFIYNMLPGQPQTEALARTASDTVGIMALPEAAPAVVASTFPYFWLIGFVVFAVVSAFLIGYYYKKNVIIITKGETK